MCGRVGLTQLMHLHENPIWQASKKSARNAAMQNEPVSPTNS
jgi:hypothetical protein